MRRSRLVEKTGAIIKLFDVRREAMIKATSERAWRVSRHAAEIVHQFCVMLIPASGRLSRSQVRDQMMANNVEWLAEQGPGEKIMIWAHTAHVDFDQQAGHKPMGAFLRERFGKEMYVCGFAFDRGTRRRNERKQTN